MGEHFVLLVDRLLTESTLEAIENRNRSMQATSSAVENPKLDYSNALKIDYEDIVLSPRKIVECRICQDEDEDSNMETPCSCCGSLKYAHRRCVQRWCNEKGDTLCEICHQQFKPGYTAPPPLFQFGRIPMDFRGNWEVSRRGSPRIIMVSTDREFLNPREYDEYSTSTARSLTWCRSVAFIFMVMLILRHTLPLTVNDYSFPLVMLLVLRTFAIVLPIYIMVRLVTAMHRRRSPQVQDLSSSSMTSSDDEETEPSSVLQPQTHIIRIETED
ncbi:hypothetical protein ACLB2K_043019 [Fragaria x ananassa]